MSNYLTKNIKSIKRKIVTFKKIWCPNRNIIVSIENCMNCDFYEDIDNDHIICKKITINDTLKLMG
jgi:hypothetical protein